MTYDYITLIYNNPLINKSMEVSILISLLTTAHNEGNEDKCHASYNDLVAMTKLSKPTIQKTLKSLREKGFISIASSYNKVHGNVTQHQIHTELLEVK